MIRTFSALLLGLLSFGALAQDTALNWTPSRITAPRAIVPNSILQLAPSIPHAILVDLVDARLYLMENTRQGPRVLRHVYASIGKNGTRKVQQGDGRTPVGVYTITSYIDGSSLPDLYGVGAFPVNYPDAWDQRAARTGYGIWVHGVPQDTYNRPPKSSEGCVTVANADLVSLSPYIQPGRTPVIFSDRLDWVDAAEQSAALEELQWQLGRWESAWEALDTDAYLEFYAAEFSTGGMNRDQFSRHKRRVNGNKKFVELELSDMSIFRYPESDDLVLVEFLQDYRSNNYSSASRKQQFWRRDDDGQWRIVQEHSS